MGKTRGDQDKLPGRFEELVRLMPPQAIADDVQLENAIEMIDRLMAIPKMTKGQALYLETLTQLVEVYESQHHAIDTDGVTGLDSLKYLLEHNNMSRTDLARLLGVHASTASRILKDERKLTADHLRTLAERFHVDPSLFL
ncbi:MAG: helix-turn-helix domain-containing protein [Phycisphaeraceae bacterium]